MQNTLNLNLLNKVEELIDKHEDTLAKLKDIENTLNEGKELDPIQNAFLRQFIIY